MSLRRVRIMSQADGAVGIVVPAAKDKVDDVVTVAKVFVN